MVGLKKKQKKNGHIHTEISPKMMKPRDKAGNAEEEENYNHAIFDRQ